MTHGRGTEMRDMPRWDGVARIAQIAENVLLHEGVIQLITESDAVVKLLDDSAPTESGQVKTLFEIVQSDHKGYTEGRVGSSRVDLQACKLEYSIVSPK